LDNSNVNRALLANNTPFHSIADAEANLRDRIDRKLRRLQTYAKAADSMLASGGISSMSQQDLEALNVPRPVATDSAFVTFARASDAYSLLASRDALRRHVLDPTQPPPAAIPIVKAYGLAGHSLKSSPLAIHVYPAPEPEDIIWSSFDSTRARRFTLHKLVVVLYGALALVCLAPVFVASSLVNAPAIGSVS
jgi:hypothetical protein